MALRNERITEGLVREAFRDLDYFNADSNVRVEEQKSSIADVSRLLKSASKTGGKGGGSPEFIVSSLDVPDIILVVECKSDVRRHESDNHDRPVDFAVDGVLLYAGALARNYHVIAVAVSGMDEDSLQVSTFLHARGEAKARVLEARGGAALNKIVAFADYVDAAIFDPAVENARIKDLMAYSRDLHNFMRDYGKLTESEKPLAVSGTLIALRNPTFAQTFDAYPANRLQRFWLKTIEDEIHDAELPQAKKENMAQPYSSISVHPELGKATTEHPKGVLNQLVSSLAQHVLPVVESHRDYDIVGQFYGEFLKYTGGDKKSLGIVLTPRHVTDLFSRLANVTKRDVVLDPCAGTAGFLISAMNHMLAGATSEGERADIRRNRLIGVENQPNMYALAASNMILRGDGKANLYQASCFDTAVSEDIRQNHRPTVGMVNPPYAQKDSKQSELSFVKQMLDVMVPGGRGIAIVPMSCATAPSVHKQVLLKHHTLEAVMSMPTELFYPVGVVTCIMVFTAGIPHLESNRKTWFGYWKDDGFIKTKHLGRVDPEQRWEGIRDQWVSEYRNRSVSPGHSVTEIVNADDEWCAEAYMETDYSTLTPADFEKTLRDYAIFRLTHGVPESEQQDA